MIKNIERIYEYNYLDFTNNLANYFYDVIMLNLSFDLKIF